MKRCFLGIIAVLILGACNSDDNGSQAFNRNDIIGKWYLKGGTTNEGAYENYNHECTTSKDYQEFLANGILDCVGYGSNCEVNDTDSSNWELKGNILTISNLNMDPMIYSYDYTVEQLTSNELRIKITENTPEGTETNVLYLTRNQ
jgi:hypothetical protein